MERSKNEKVRKFGSILKNIEYKISMHHLEFKTTTVYKGY